MKKTNIFLAGLPSVGKSTYLTALWAVEKDGRSGHLLTCDDFPSDSSYIDGMRNNWIELKEVRRTTFAEPTEIVLPMRSSRTGNKINLAMPDFQGEIFQRVISNSISSNIDEWCDRSDGILFMLRMPTTSPEMLQEQISPKTEPRLEMEKVVMQTKDIEVAIQNLILLKYLYSRMGDCPISLCFSLWDIADNANNETMEKWVKVNHPCIYNFVTEHFTKFRFYGISAQGASYEDLSEEEGDKLAEKTTKKQRAYVYTDQLSYDITEPLYFLISTQDED